MAQRSVMGLLVLPVDGTTKRNGSLSQLPVNRNLVVNLFKYITNSA